MRIRIADETPLDLKLLKLPIIKGSKSGCHSAKSADQPELSGGDVNDKPEPRLLRKREYILGFTLHIKERVACREKVRGQMVAAVGHIGEIAHPIRCLQRTVQQIAPSLDMSRPRQDETSEAHIGPGLKALQSALFDEVMAEPAESKSGLVVAEARSRDHAKPNIGEARAVTIASLEAKIDRPTDDQGKQVRIRMQGRRSEFGQNIQRREGCRVPHQRQLDQILDRAVPELRPDPLIFPYRFRFRRMRRPLDAQMPEVFETDRDRAGALIEGHVQIDAQARDGRLFDRIFDAG